MIREIREFFPAAMVLGLLAPLPGCGDQESTAPSTVIPPPAERPLDPGLSYAFSCVTSGPIDHPVEFGSRPLSGIPALIDPPFVKADEVDYLFERDWVFGVEIDRRFFAFPARILNYHEVVTFSVDSYRYAATW